MKLRPRVKKIKRKSKTYRPHNLSKKGTVKWLLDGAIKRNHNSLPDPCLERPDIAKDSHGYTQIQFQRKSRLVHRMVYEIMVGPIGKNLYVLHKCDNSACIAPKHLHEGTPQDNMNEKVERGRARGGSLKGEQHGSARLTTKQVKQIRRLSAIGVLQRKIGARFGISKGYVSDIVRRKKWNHI